MLRLEHQVSRKTGKFIKPEKKEKPARSVGVLPHQSPEGDVAQELEKDLNTLSGRVGDKHFTFVLNSGARITAVPEEAVDREMIRKETVRVRDANRGIKSRNLADVLLTVAGRQITQAPGDSFDVKILLSINFTKEEDFELIKHLREM